MIGVALAQGFVDPEREQDEEVAVGGGVAPQLRREEGEFQAVYRRLEGLS